VRLTPEGEGEEIRDILLSFEADEIICEPGQSLGLVVHPDQTNGKEESFRLYSVADITTCESGKSQVSICVKRCNYMDEYTGMLSPGRVSNYLCDQRPGSKLSIKGPFGVPFSAPASQETDIILIAAGTGIAPFRAFMKKLYRTEPDRPGRVWTFYGAMTGLEQLYRNDEDRDFTQYYDQETFDAFHHLSVQLEENSPILLDFALRHRANALWKMMHESDTCLFVAGQQKILTPFNQVFSGLAGSEEEWEQCQAKWASQGRWALLEY
jgi:ferredoxin--NADP+ reductase